MNSKTKPEAKPKADNVGAATARLNELSHGLEGLCGRLAATTSTLGVAVADGDDKKAASLRDELDRQDARRRELEAAIPVAAQRLQEAQERDASKRQAAEAKKANKSRSRRLEAARKLDAAWRALARAFEEHSACDTGGEVKDRAAIAIHAPRFHRTAVSHWAPDLARTLGICIVAAAHRRSLEDCEAGVITEVEVEHDA